MPPFKHEANHEMSKGFLHKRDWSYTYERCKILLPFIRSKHNMPIFCIKKIFVDMTYNIPSKQSSFYLWNLINWKKIDFGGFLLP
jgi:hypothetical protein